MLQSVFYSLSTLISAYSFVCLIRIFMTWMPQLGTTTIGHFIASLCDPYLNWFRRFPFTRIGMIDFSPVIALGVLSVASMSFSRLAITGQITLGIVLASLVQVLWSFVSFFLLLLILFLIIRLIYDIINRYGFSQFWTTLDRFLNPPISYITRLFLQGRTVSYRTSLILTLVFMVALRFGLDFGLAYVISFLMRLPV